MSQVVDSIEAAQVTNITQNNCILLKKKKKSFDLRKIHFQNEGYFKNNPHFNPNTTNVKCEVSDQLGAYNICLLYTSPSPRDRTRSRMPSSA